MAGASTIRRRTAEFLAQAHIAVTPEEVAEIEIADFGLSDVEHIGLEILVYMNSPRYCAKELVLFPGQTCPMYVSPPWVRQKWPPARPS